MKNKMTNISWLKVLKLPKGPLDPTVLFENPISDIWKYRSNPL
jgi:hypothetical protein